MRVIAGRFVERTSSSPFFCIFINTYYYTIIDARPQTPRGQSVTIDNDQKFRKERNITSTQMKIDSGSGTGSVTPERVAAIKRGEAAMQQQFASLMSASAPPPAPLLPPREALPFHHIFDGNKTMFKSGHTATVLRTFMDSISFM
ncbi:hypothetical protein E4U36_008001 [Claviceps purpurea]|nr:hypothetical protein E4U36_008001 [Claviceps purpurea]